MDIVKTLVRVNALLLQGAYQGAENVLDSAIVDARELQAENERLNSAWQVEALNRKDLIIAKQEKENDRIKAELSETKKAFDAEIILSDSRAEQVKRLQSIIDEANAQQVPDAIKLLQRVAASTTESIDSKQSVDRQTIIDILVSSGNLSEGVTADLIISAISAKPMQGDVVRIQCTHCGTPVNFINQPSPAVAVPDYDNMDALINELREHIAQPPHLQSEEFIKGCLHALDTLKCRTKTKRDWLLRTQSPRITEQDVLDSLEAFHAMYNRHAWRHFYASWIKSTEYCALLNKLNAKPESVGG